MMSMMLHSCSAMSCVVHRPIPLPPELPNLSPHSGIIVLMLSRLLPVTWQCHTVVSDHTVSNLSPHSGIISVDVVTSVTFQLAMSH